MIQIEQSTLTKINSVEVEFLGRRSTHGVFVNSAVRPQSTYGRKMHGDKFRVLKADLARLGKILKPVVKRPKKIIEPIIAEIEKV
jgi:hypothetical protein